MVRISLIGLVLLSVVSIGCTDNNNGPNAATIPPASDGNNSSELGVNGPLVGEIWVTDRLGTERVNLQTGEVIVVSEERAYPSKDGSVYVEYLKDQGRALSDNCGAVLYNDTQQISVIDTRSREVLSSFILDRDILGPVRLSPDGKRVAMYVAEIATGNECDKNDSNFRFSVFSTGGEELFRNSEVGLHAYDWHPEGRLVIVRYQQESETYSVQIESTPNSLRFETLLDFSPGNVVSYVGLRIGPKGNDAVMEGVYATSPGLSGVSYREAGAFHFNLFGGTEEPSLFRQSEEQRVNSPVFSPDGKFIMVTVGYASGGLINYTVLPDSQVLSGTELRPEILPVSTGSVSYVVPVGVKGQPMPPETYSDTLRPVLSNDSVGSLRIIGFKPLDGYSWTPVID